MRRMRNTAVRIQRNIFGRRARGPIPLEMALALAREGRFGREEFLDLIDRGFQFPVLGGTTAQNQVADSPIYVPINVMVTTDQTVNQGDMVYWDPVNFTLKPLTAASQVAGQYMGVAGGTNNPNVYPAPAAGTPSDNLPGIAVQRGGTVWLNGTTGDGAYNPWQPVTVGADAQTVSRGGETTANRVGFVAVHAPTTAAGAPGATPVPPATDSNARIRVWVEPKYPDTALL